jgi:uncharacterized damage-inducible protein DinB
VPSTPVHLDDHGYLQESRRQVVHALDGLGDYEVRHPMTATGTNLLGVVKHLIGVEAGYLGLCLGQPFGEPLPWIDGAGSDLPNADMWAREEESRDYILSLYRQACEHSDRVLTEVGPDAAATVPWWPEDQRETTAAALLSRVLKDTAMHAGQLQILRELIDGRAGSDRDAIGDDAWWRDYTTELEQVALRFVHDRVPQTSSIQAARPAAERGHAPAGRAEPGP